MDRVLPVATVAVSVAVPLVLEIVLWGVAGVGALVIVGALIWLLADWWEL